MKARSSLCLFVPLLLAACASIDQAEPEKLTFQPLTYVLPRDRNLAGTGLAALRFEPLLEVVRRGSSSELLSRKATIEGDAIVVTNQSFITDRKGRFDQPGIDLVKRDEVGVQYTLRCEPKEGEAEVRLVCALAGRKTFDHTSFGVGSRHDARLFAPQDLAAYLKDAVSVSYTFELDSPWNSESTLANFHRQLKEDPSEEDGRDRITGKIFRGTYLLRHRDRDVRLSVQVYPYKNGSKTIATLKLPGIASGPETVDFSATIKAVKEEIRAIVNS
ncbi:MAG TPA: hypothetical protein PKC23_09005 [Candidatus Desulfobacillus sp.]|nr:hypothetical protein [Candidatus Desulfobacillus sp.]